MNYIKLFAKGGKIDTKAIKAEIARIFMLEDSPEKVEQLWQDAVNTYGSEEGVLSEIFKQVGDNPSDESVQKAMMNVLNYTPMEESRIFKCGGKLQQLVSKFGKGGSVDCGCGGIKVGQEGFKTSGNGTDPDAGFHTWDIEITPQKDTIVNYSYPSYNGKAILTPNGGTVKEWLNGDSLPTVYRDRNWFARHPRRALLPFIGNLNNAKIMNARELAQNHIPSQQEGGVMLERMPGYDVSTNLTRRQARQLAAQNQGYSGEQFQYAMANAKNALRNQGLRGRELRERAREMAAGISPVQQSIVSTPAQLVGSTEIPSGFGNIVGIKEGDLRPQTPIVQSIVAPAKPTTPAKPAKRGVEEFGNISVDGTPSNTTVANSPVTPIKRKGLDGTAVSIDSGVWGIDGTPLGRLYTENIPEQPHVVRSGRDNNGNYYEVSDGMAGIDTNGNYYIKTITPPKKKTAKPAPVPAGGGSFSWMSFKCGGKVESDKCGGKPKAKKAECGVKLKPAMKCGGKTKKK